MLSYSYSYSILTKQAIYGIKIVLMYYYNARNIVSKDHNYYSYLGRKN